MPTSQSKISLSRSQDIPFNKLTLSQTNVRRVKAGISVEELAEDIARRGLLQSLCVRPVCDADGTETGTFEIPAGGRRYRALQLLVSQKRMAKTQPVPCVVRRDGVAEEDSLAENIQRVALHPLDQFRAFQTLRGQGFSEEDIAARFFVSLAVVRQRLKLASVSRRLLDLYAEDALTLDQLMAFTVTSDHARQEQVWENVNRSYFKEPHNIRRQLTEGAVRISDKRAQFVGVEVYQAAGGIVLRDLFESDDGGWLQDAALLERLVTEKLTSTAESLRHEGWKWIQAAPEFPYGHTMGMHRLSGERTVLSDEEKAAIEALRSEFDQLQADYAEADELPEAVDARLGEIETALEAHDSRPLLYDPAAKARAGVFLSIDPNGGPRIERGYVRPEDAPPSDPDAEPQVETELSAARFMNGVTRTQIVVGGNGAAQPLPEEDDGIKPLSDRLVTDLTAHRTLALRERLASHYDSAFLAVLHALCLPAFYHHVADTCLEITARCSGFASQAPGLAECAPAKAIESRHAEWAAIMPATPGELWQVLLMLPDESRRTLFAHCASLTVNAVHEPFGRSSGRLAHADRLAAAAGLDMAAAGWVPTVDNYLGRVTKARILEAVREARGEAAAQLIDHLKKPEMAKEAERLLAGSGWLPEPLRLAAPEAAPKGESGSETAALPDFLAASDGSDASALAAE